VYFAYYIYLKLLLFRGESAVALGTKKRYHFEDLHGTIGVYTCDTAVRHGAHYNMCLRLFQRRSNLRVSDVVSPVEWNSDPSERNSISPPANMG